jgi:hypothetical protein
MRRGNGTRKVIYIGVQERNNPVDSAGEFGLVRDLKLITQMLIDTPIVVNNLIW